MALLPALPHAGAQPICGEAETREIIDALRRLHACPAPAGGFCVREISYLNPVGVLRFALAVDAAHPLLDGLEQLGPTSRREGLERTARAAGLWLGLVAPAPGSEAAPGLLQQVRDLREDCDLPATAERMRGVGFAEVLIPRRREALLFAVYADGRIRPLGAAD